MTDAEKIARFAGLTEESIGYTDYFDPDDGHLIERKIHWPDFTSLDVLFKWCVPKLPRTEQGHLYISVTQDKYEAGWIAYIGEIEGRGDTPGEALRAAILALIGDGDE